LEEVGQDDQPILMKGVEELGAITRKEKKMGNPSCKMKDRARHDLMLKSNNLFDKVCSLTLAM